MCFRLGVCKQKWCDMRLSGEHVGRHASVYWDEGRDSCAHVPSHATEPKHLCISPSDIPRVPKIRATVGKGTFLYP